MAVLHRCVICGVLNAEMEGELYRCKDCGSVFSDGFRRLTEDIEVPR